MMQLNSSPAFSVVQVFAFAAAVLLSSCAARLTPGVSGVADVERAMGEPTEVRPAPNNETLRWYTRSGYGGLGERNYAARIGADGKLVSLEQRLTEEYIARVIPGDSDADDVLETIGPPSRSYPRSRIQREVWEYRLETFLRPSVLMVQFSPDRVVREVYVLEGRDLQ